MNQLSFVAVGFSFFFELIRQEWTGSNSAPLHRICTLMRKMGVCSFVREELVPNQEILDEQQAAETRTGGPAQAKAVRLTFFRSHPPSGSWRDISDDDVLGYAVILTVSLQAGTPRSFVLESVVRTPSIWIPSQPGSVQPETVTNYYVHCSRDCETIVGTAAASRTFQLRGSFFCVQPIRLRGLPVRVRS